MSESLLFQQIEEVRCQTHHNLNLWMAEQSAELTLAYESLQQTLEELEVVEEELREQNEQLAKSREMAELDRRRYQDLFEFAPDGYLVTDTAGVIQEANFAAAALLNLQQKHLLGKPLVVLIAQPDRQPFLSKLKNLQHLQEWEIYLQPRKGSPFPASIKVAAIHDAQGRHMGWRWLLCNISDRKQVESALRRAHDELEIRVAERTAELTLTNALLQQEITERQSVQQALQQSEKLYRDLVERQTELIIRFDCQGRPTFANAAASQTFGLSLDELRGQSLFQFAHPEDLPQVMANMTVLTSEPHHLNTGEQRLVTVNGVRWFEWNITPIENETGEVVEFQSVGRDITERKQIEEALRQSEEKFRHFAKNSQAVIWMARPDPLQNVYVNPAYEKIWGRSCQSLRDQPENWIETIHVEDRDRVIAKLQELHCAESWETEYRIVRPDGSIRWVWDRGFPIRDEQGNIYAYGGIAEDITERKLAEESVRESEARLSLALEAAHMGTWDWNLLSNECIWSANMGPLYGLPIGYNCPNFETFVNFIHPEDRQAVAETLNRTIAQGIDWAFEFRVIWPDGSIHWLNGRGKVYHNLSST